MGYLINCTLKQFEEGKGLAMTDKKKKRVEIKKVREDSYQLVDENNGQEASPEMSREAMCVFLLERFFVPKVDRMIRGADKKFVVRAQAEGQGEDGADFDVSLGGGSDHLFLTGQEIEAKDPKRAPWQDCQF